MKTAYIFDLDGVLIDSKHMMQQAWQICELEHKLTQSFDEYFKCIGMPFKDILQTIGIEDNHDAIKRFTDHYGVDVFLGHGKFKMFSLLKCYKKRGDLDTR